MVDDATDALYTLNRTTGRATRVRSSTTQFGASITNPRGLAWHRTKATLYMITSTALYELNRWTGVATQVASRAGANTLPSTVTNPSGLASGSQRLYMVDAATDALYVLDTSGESTRGGATRVGNLRVSVPLPARIVSNPAGLAWVNSTNTLYMGGDNPDNLYQVDQQTGAPSRVKGLGAITDLADIEWAGTTMYAVDDSTDALYTIPGISSSTPTRTLAASSIPSEGDLYYNGRRFADAYMKWENPTWDRNIRDCEMDATNCSTYEHDLTLPLTWFVSSTPIDGYLQRLAAQILHGYCTTWSTLPQMYDDCSTAGSPATVGTFTQDTTNIEMSFGSFKANAIADGRFYYGNWRFTPLLPAASRTAPVRLVGQPGEFETTYQFGEPVLCENVIVHIKCVKGLEQSERRLISTSWTYDTPHYSTFKRLR